MIEDTPEAWKEGGKSIENILSSLKSYLDDPKGYNKPNMMILIDPREDGRTHISFKDYLAEGIEGESYIDYANRVGKAFIILQNHWVYRSTKSIDDAVEKWNSGDAIDISEELSEYTWKETVDGIMNHYVEEEE